VRVVAQGLVQGVGYRWFVQRSAERFSLTGWVRNLPSGEVEAEAQGERGMIDEFIRALRVGPRSAQVTRLAVDPRPAVDGESTFEIRGW
jgi:acylphosphatase